jgi:hypothetical protein
MSTSSSDVFHRIKSSTAEKVRKLLAQAEDPAATPEEAQSFTMKAQQLMSKHSIDLAMVTDARRAGAVVEKAWTLQNPYATHKVTLVNAVARANDCRTIYTNLDGGRRLIEIVGYPEDVEWVETLSRSLELQMAGALTEAVRRKPPGVHGRTYAVGFVHGFIAEVGRRLQAARRQAIAATEAVREQERRAAQRLALEAGLDAEAPAAGPSVALVLVAKQEHVDDEFKVRHPLTRTVYRHTRLRSWSGYGPGLTAGSRASLARGAVDGTRRSLSA